MPRVRWFPTAFVTTVGLLATTGVAEAGTATVSGGTLVYEDAVPARDNVMRVDDIFGIDSAYQVRDNAGVTAGTGCVAVNANEARCARTGVTAIRLALGPGNDNATLRTVGSEHGELLGQDGDDVLIGALGDDLVVGGPGADQLDGALGNNTLRGGSEDDLLLGGSGNDALDGEAGDDRLIPVLGADLVSGGSGRDEVSYSGSLDPVLVSLDDVANDGIAGAHANIRSDVEDVVGGFNADTLVGSAAANRIRGGASGDVIDGAGGTDTIGGEAGADRIEARDGLVDVVDCGTESDVVNADAGDAVSECETIQPARMPAASPSPPPPAPATANPPTATMPAPAVATPLRRRGTRVLLTSVPARDTRSPYVFKVKGLVTATSGSLQLTCRGTVRLRVRADAKTLATSSITIERKKADGPDCSFAGTLKLTGLVRVPRGGRRIMLQVRYDGSALNRASRTVTRIVRVG